MNKEKYTPTPESKQQPPEEFEKTLELAVQATKLHDKLLEQGDDEGAAEIMETIVIAKDLYERYEHGELVPRDQLEVIDLQTDFAFVFEEYGHDHDSEEASLEDSPVVE